MFLQGITAVVLALAIMPTSSPFTSPALAVVPATSNHSVAIYVHFDKCGSSTIRAMLRGDHYRGYQTCFLRPENKNNQQQTMAQMTKEEANPFHWTDDKDVLDSQAKCQVVLASHYGRCLNNSAHPRTHCQYFTILRDPVSRLVSEYNYFCLNCNDNKKFCQKRFSSCPNLSFLDWAKSRSNQYTRRFANDADDGYYNQYLLGWDAEATYDQFTRASANLIRPNMYVMWTEDLNTTGWEMLEDYLTDSNILPWQDAKATPFPESLSQYASRISMHANSHEKRSRGHEKRYTPTADELHSATKLNRYDMALRNILHVHYNRTRVGSTAQHSKAVTTTMNALDMRLLELSEAAAIAAPPPAAPAAPLPPPSSTAAVCTDWCYGVVKHGTLTIPEACRYYDCKDCSSFPGSAETCVLSNLAAVTPPRASEASCKPWCKTFFTSGKETRGKICGYLNCRGCAFGGSPCNNSVK